MITYDINGTKYKMPTYWNEVPLGTYQKLMTVELTDEIETYVKLVSILTGMTEDFIYDLPYKTFQAILTNSKFVFDQSPELHTFELTINGVTYKMASNITDMNTREYIDLDNLIKVKEDAPKNLHYIMAILYRPVDETGKITKYDDSTLEERADLFQKYMMCNYVMSAMIFFSEVGSICLNIIQESLEMEVKAETMKPKKKNLLKQFFKRYTDGNSSCTR